MGTLSIIYTNLRRYLTVIRIRRRASEYLPYFFRTSYIRHKMENFPLSVREETPLRAMTQSDSDEATMAESISTMIHMTVAYKH